MAKDKTKKRSKQESLELTKTLVLNFNEVEKVAKYEKKTSKKPAIIIAFIGIFAIFSGIVYSNTYSLNKKDSNPSKYRKTTKVTKKIDKLICTKNSNEENNKITVNETVTLNFKKNKLYNYQNVIVSTVVDSKLDKTPKFITDLDNKVKDIKKESITGYTITSNNESKKNVISKYTLKLIINLEKYDDSKIKDKSNKYLNITYKYKDNALKVREDLIKSGYTCN